MFHHSIETAGFAGFANTSLPPAHIQGVPVSPWAIEPGFAIALSLAAFVYALGLFAIAKRPDRPWSRMRAIAWFAGLTALAAAYGGPVEAYSDDSLAFHMVQHLILLQLAPPLLLLGRPLELLRLAFPGLLAKRLLRYRAGASPRHVPWTSWLARSRPALWVGLVFNLNLLLWHLPPAYDAALRSPRVHAAEHLGFLLSALAFWWLVLNATGGGASHAAYGLCFAGCMAGMLVALALVFAAEPLYPWYAMRPRGAHPLGLDALTDQRIGGFIMFLGGLAYLLLLLRMLAKEAGAR